MRRQKSANTKRHNHKSETPKSLGARYAELLRLREAVSRTQAELKLSTSAERAVTKEGRTFRYH